MGLRYLLAALVVSWTQAAAGATISLGGPAASDISRLEASAWVGSLRATAGSLQPAALPFVDDHSATEGGSSVQAEYALASASLQASFSMELGLDFVPFSAVDGRIYFSVDRPATYLLGGSLMGSDADGIRLFQSATLFDLTTWTTLFQAQQDARDVSDTTLSLGLQEGNFDNQLVGSTTGALLPGRFYFFEYRSVLQDQDASSTTGSVGSGSFRLLVVPEPSAHLAMALGLLVLGAWRSRERPLS